MCHDTEMDEEYEYATAEFVTDPETGEVLAIEHTREYAKLVRAFHERECKHSETEPYRVRIANGAVQVRNCCTHCGERVGTAISQKDKAWVESLPWQSTDLSDSYSNRREVERKTMLLDLAKRQYAERGRFTESYSAYMQSDEWRAKRALVMKRCGGVCEGCGTAEATDTHHLTYRHLFHEFLFELVGLCRPCHDRITFEDRETRNSQDDDEELAEAISDCF